MSIENNVIDPRVAEIVAAVDRMSDKLITDGLYDDPTRPSLVAGMDAIRDRVGSWCAATGLRAPHWVEEFLD